MNKRSGIICLRSTIITSERKIMVQRGIRILHSDEPVPPLFCKVYVLEGKIELEIKGKDNRKRVICWEDFILQVKAAVAEEKAQKLNKS